MKYRVYKTMTTHAFCDVESDNEDNAIETAQNLDRWFEDEDDFSNEFEAEKI